jgi:hypothetical protein
MLITAKLKQLNAIKPTINALLLLPAPILDKDHVLDNPLKNAPLISAQRYLQQDALIKSPHFNALF